MNLNLTQRVFYSFALLFLICCFAACKKSSDNPQVLIVGKWNLQRYHIAEYENGAKSYDTTYVSPSTLPSPNYTLFSSDGSFMNIEKDGSLLDTTKGNYSLTGTAILFSNSRSNWCCFNPYTLVFCRGKQQRFFRCSVDKPDQFS